MKLYYLLLLLSLNISSYAQEITAEKCRCYCSDLCGPRDRKAADTPFYDAEYDKCFCAPRDKENYIPNECHLKNNTEETNCCSMQEEEDNYE